MIQGPPGNDGSTGEPGATGKEVSASFINSTECFTKCVSSQH